MRATLVVLVVAAILVAALPLTHRAQAREGALASPSLHESAEDGARLMEWQGTSAIFVKGACLAPLKRCFGSHESEDGRFFLPVSASDGHIVVGWLAVNDSLRELRVSVGGLTVEGPSPIVIDVLGGVAGEYAVHAEPVRTGAGAWDQSISWTATFRVASAPERVLSTGIAGYEAGVPCALVVCDTTLRQHGEALVVPWTARGQIALDWDPSVGALRVGLAGTSLAVEGEPPLVLPVDALPPGEWRFDVRKSVVGPLARVDVRWSADLVSGEQTSS